MVSFASLRSIGLCFGAALAVSACNSVTATGEIAPDVTAAAPAVAAAPAAPATSDLDLGRMNFAAGRFGLAELHFRRAVESPGAGADAWLGLAASYDQLRRYDLADRAYARAEQIGGRTAVYLNNRGFSYLQRKNIRLASQNLTEALAKDPENVEIAANLQTLDAQARGGAQRR